MKKVVFVLVVLLLAAPALAEVVITAAQVGDTNQVTISYEVTAPDVNLPRAFGLDITVTDGNIVACEPYMVGECNDVLQGYGIFPGAFGAVITVLPDGTVEDWGVAGYTPVSDVEPALDGLGSDGITIEMGSLYVDSNYPGLSGLLCTITVTEECTVTIEGNAARCGDGRGVIMEDPEEVPDVNYVDGEVVLDRFPSDHPDYDEWVLVGKPDSWCYPKQCHGDATGSDEEFGRGNFISVGMADFQALLAGYGDNTYVDPATDPWIAADFTHSDEEFGRGNFIRVGMADFQVLLAYYGDEQSTVPGDCLDVP